MKIQDKREKIYKFCKKHIINGNIGVCLKYQTDDYDLVGELKYFNELNLKIGIGRKNCGYFHRYTASGKSTFYVAIEGDGYNVCECDRSDM